jgi:hypothetical protein
MAHYGVVSPRYWLRGEVTSQMNRTSILKIKNNGYRDLEVFLLMAPQKIPRADLPMKDSGVGWAGDKIFLAGSRASCKQSIYQTTYIHLSYSHTHRTYLSLTDYTKYKVWIPPVIPLSYSIPCETTPLLQNRHHSWSMCKNLEMRSATNAIWLSGHGKIAQRLTSWFVVMPEIWNGIEWVLETAGHTLQTS